MKTINVKKDKKYWKAQATDELKQWDAALTVMNELVDTLDLLAKSPSIPPIPNTPRFMGERMELK